MSPFFKISMVVGLGWLVSGLSSALADPPGPRPLVLMYHDIIASKTGDAALCKKATDRADEFGKQLYCLVTSDVVFSNFFEQMKFLHDSGYQTLSMEEFYAIKKHQAPMPARSVLITFDDGYDGNFNLAMPVLASMQMKATFFVHTAYVGVKTLVYPPLADPLPADAKTSSKVHMTWAQLKTMEAMKNTQGQPLFRVYSHTLTHPRLTEIQDPEILRQELCNSRISIEANLGGVRDFLAYPFGAYTQVENGRVKLPFDSHVLDRVKGCQYRMAMSITNIPGTPTADAQGPWLTERLGVGLNYDTLSSFRSDAAKFQQNAAVQTTPPSGRAMSDEDWDHHTAPGLSPPPNGSTSN